MSTTANLTTTSNPSATPSSLITIGVSQSTVNTIAISLGVTLGILLIASCILIKILLVRTKALKKMLVVQSRQSNKLVDMGDLGVVSKAQYGLANGQWSKSSEVVTSSEPRELDAGLGDVPVAFRRI